MENQRRRITQHGHETRAEAGPSPPRSRLARWGTWVLCISSLYNDPDTVETAFELDVTGVDVTYPMARELTIHTGGNRAISVG